MADPIEELNMVFQTCRIADPVVRTNIINREGFTSLEDLGVLETDTDVSDMAKRLASRTQAEGRVYLGTVVVKRLQTLVWWVRDHQKRGLTVNAADFTVQEMNQAAEMKGLKREMTDKEPSVSDLGKFDPDDFDAYEDAFLNLLAQTYGVIREPLRYVVRPDVAPDTFATTEEQRMYQFPLAGNSFELDNQSVYRKRKAFLIDSPGWAWIEPHDTAEDGRAAYMAWTAHYNGEGELSKRTAIAKAKLDQLHYKNERSMSFEKCRRWKSYSKQSSARKASYWPRRSSSTSNTHETLPAHVDISPSRLPESTALPSSNISNRGERSEESMQSTQGPDVVYTDVDELEAAADAEAVEAEAEATA